MDGISGLEGWRWIFILEGIVTAAVGLAAFFWIHDAPRTAKFLTKPEKRWVSNRLKRKTASGRYIEISEHFDWRCVIQGLTDWQIYRGVVINWSTACTIYGMSYFLPTIVNQLGYTGQQANLLTVPGELIDLLCRLIANEASLRMRLHTDDTLVLAFRSHKE